MEAINENDVIEKECEEFFGKDFEEDSLEKNKNRFNRRKTDAKKAIRKRKITKEVYYSEPNSKWDYYDNLHQYSKNKIHCSCPICRAKTKKKKNVLGSFHKKGKNWKHSDWQKIQSFEDKIKEPE